jgi:patatin-like phospholipase/acyl hydrolase
MSQGKLTTSQNLRPRYRALVACILSLALAACGTVDRPALTAADYQSAPQLAALSPFRFAATDQQSFLAWNATWSQQRAALGLQGIQVLSLSGGGANGAYGAGVVVGWTKTGERPKFDIVTGVSTGALIAPLVFAGPAWDERLTAAYHDSRLEGLLTGTVRAVFRPSLFSARVLTQVVDSYVDEALLKAIAAEYDAGRRLVVATTNIDTQESVVWDLGAIAKSSLRPDDQGRSLRLFREVLVASASIPGAFPPAMINWDGAAGLAEMHVDGGVTTPFLIVPESMTQWLPQPSMRPTKVYLIIDGKISPTYAMTRGGIVSIILRSLDTNGRADARAHVQEGETFAARNGATFAYTAIPDDDPADQFNFKSDNLERLYELGYQRALHHQAFRAADPIPDPAQASADH